MVMVNYSTSTQPVFHIVTKKGCNSKASLPRYPLPILMENSVRKMSTTGLCGYDVTNIAKIQHAAKENTTCTEQESKVPGVERQVLKVASVEEQTSTIVSVEEQTPTIASVEEQTPKSTGAAERLPKHKGTAQEVLLNKGVEEHHTPQNKDNLNSEEGQEPYSTSEDESDASVSPNCLKRKRENGFPSDQQSEANQVEPEASPEKVAVEKLKRRRARIRHTKPKGWNAADDLELKQLVEANGNRNWGVISHLISTERSAVDCKVRWEGCISKTVKKGSWDSVEDELLSFYASQYIRETTADEIRLDWSVVALHVPNRTGKQCRERWVNHLSPSINRSPWTPEEDKRLLEQLELYPRRWAKVARELSKGRTENMVKVRYHALARSIPVITTNKASEPTKDGTPSLSTLVQTSDLTQITNSRRKRKSQNLKESNAKQGHKTKTTSTTTTTIPSMSTSGPIISNVESLQTYFESKPNLFAMYPVARFPGDYMMHPVHIDDTKKENIEETDSVGGTIPSHLRDYLDEIAQDLESFYPHP